MSAYQNVERLLHYAHTCNDPELLRAYARQLEQWGQWEEAAKARQRAHEIEQRQTERRRTHERAR